MKKDSRAPKYLFKSHFWVHLNPDSVLRLRPGFHILCHFPLCGDWLLEKVGRPQWKPGFPSHRRFLALGFLCRRKKLSVCMPRLFEDTQENKTHTNITGSVGWTNKCDSFFCFLPCSRLFKFIGLTLTWSLLHFPFKMYFKISIQKWYLTTRSCHKSLIKVPEQLESLLK